MILEENLIKEIQQFNEAIKSWERSIEAHEEFMRLYPEIPCDNVKKTIAEYEGNIKRAKSCIEKIKVKIEEQNRKEGD